MCRAQSSRDFFYLTAVFGKTCPKLLPALRNHPTNPRNRTDWYVLDTIYLDLIQYCLNLVILSIWWIASSIISWLTWKKVLWFSSSDCGEPMLLKVFVDVTLSRNHISMLVSRFFQFWNLKEWIMEEVIPDHSHNLLPAVLSHFC